MLGWISRYKKVDYYTGVIDFDCWVQYANCNLHREISTLGIL